MRVMYRVPDAPAESFPAKEIDQFTEIVDEGTGGKKGNQDVKMLVPEIRLFHLEHSPLLSHSFKLKPPAVE